MPDHLTAHLALRARLLTLSVCTTGSTTLAATSTGYTRAAGSFLTDGFVVGQEVTPTGFTQTDTGVIDELTATVMTIRGGRDVESSGAGRTLAVLLPERRAWENVVFDPDGQRDFIEEEFVPGTATVRTAPVTGGVAESTGLYVIRWYGQTKVDVPALRKAADAVLELFPAGLAVTASLRIQGTFAPQAGQIRPDNRGWAVVVITIPWRLESTN